MQNERNNLNVSSEISPKIASKPQDKPKQQSQRNPLASVDSNRGSSCVSISARTEQ